MMGRTIKTLVAIGMTLQYASADPFPGTPDGLPLDFDCSLRQAALEFGQDLLPDRGSFRTLFEALKLGECGAETPTDYDEWTPPNYPTPTSGVVVFVAPYGDDGANDGTQDRPWKTIQHAVDRTAGGPATLLLRAGRYYEAGSVKIGAESSGLTIQNFEGECATLSGALGPITLPASAWTQYKRHVGWETFESVNNVFGDATSNGNTSTVKYLGSFSSSSECASAAGDGSVYNSFAYHESSFGGDFATQCFGRTDRQWTGNLQDGVTSGLFKRQNVWKADVSSWNIGEEMPGLRLGGERQIRAKYPNGGKLAFQYWHTANWWQL